MEKIEITVVGAGVIGLAVAFELSKTYSDIFVIEKNHSFGQETSSRNSEVIHAGIYYPKDSLKARTCIEGRRLLYEFCAKFNIPHKKIGKLIVAIDDNEIKDLETLFKNGKDNGVADLELLSEGQIKKMEPYVQAKAAIYSPSTGIIDSHKLMEKFILQFKSQDVQIAYNTELIGIDKIKDGFEVTVNDKQEGVFKFSTRVLINSAGLNSDKVAAMAGLIKDEYKLKYCKGDYFRVSGQKSKFINHLIYPVPRKEGAGLGIHATLDLSGGLRLGPDDEYVKNIDYQVNISKQKQFFASAHKFLPFVDLEDLKPDISGIRPKLSATNIGGSANHYGGQGQQESFRDFIIKDETENGLAGFINLIGIESPGLTACLSIARTIKGMLLQ